MYNWIINISLTEKIPNTYGHATVKITTKEYDQEEAKRLALLDRPGWEVTEVYEELVAVQAFHIVGRVGQKKAYATNLFSKEQAISDYAKTEFIKDSIGISYLASTLQTLNVKGGRFDAYDVWEVE